MTRNEQFDNLEVVLDADIDTVVGNLDVGGELSEAGSRVATLQSVQDDLDAYGELGVSETITGDWGVATDAQFSFGDNGEFHYRVNTNDELLLEATQNQHDVGLRVRGDGSVETGTLEENGERVATRSWTSGEIDGFTDGTVQETVTAEWTFGAGLQTDDGMFVDGGNVTINSVSGGAGGVLFRDSSGTRRFSLRWSDNDEQLEGILYDSNGDFSSAAFTINESEGFDVRTSQFTHNGNTVQTQ